MIVLTLVFGTLFGKDDPTYPVYILCGRLLYSFFSSATKAGLKAVSGNAAMIKKVYVPKYIYVVAADCIELCYIFNIAHCTCRSRCSS